MTQAQKVPLKGETRQVLPRECLCVYRIPRRGGLLFGAVIVKLTPWMLAILAFLIVVLLAGAYFAKRFFKREPAPVPVSTRENLPVALSDISPGTEIQASYLASAPMRRERANEFPDIVKSRDALIGRIAKEHIPMATPLRLSMFYPIGEAPPIQLDPGHRLVSVNVGNSTGMVSGLIRKGQFVDVMMTVDQAGTGGGTRLNNIGTGSTGGLPGGRDPMTLQLFDGVKVYEITRARSARGAQDVVLELTPEQQRIMILAKDKGAINLSYNPQGPGNGGVSVQASRDDRILLSEILGYEDPLPEPDEEPQPFLTEQYRNGGRSNAWYDEDGKRTGPPRNQNGFNNGGFGNGGVPLQNSNSFGGNWDTTQTDAPAAGDAHQQTAQQTVRVGS